MDEPLRVLLVEDCEDDALLVLRELRRGGNAVEWARVDQPAAMRSALDTQAWDLIISDYSMPGFSALEALAVLRERDMDVPFIMISGTVGEETAVAAMKAGAADYLTKGNLARLIPAVERELREAGSRRERRQAEEALKQSQEQLFHAQKMEAVGRLAGGVAHDFNNMLAVINGYSEILLDRYDLDPRAQGFISEIEKAGAGAARLTRQLLAFSRRQVLESKALDLNAAVNSVHGMLRRLIGAHIEFVSVPGSEVWIFADPGQVEQILLNLAVNARDAMPGGGRVTLEVETVEVEEPLSSAALEVKPGRYAVLSVSDTGCGMDAATLSRIFEPFFTTKDVGKGTGIGLATVHGIVQQSGGSIQVESKPGGGTTFRIYLPEVEPGEADQEGAALPLSGGAETVLLVEDEPLVRGVVREVLLERGYTVLEATHGEEALRMGLQHPEPIHLLLTDLIMPMMGGRELAEQFQRLRPKSGVLFMSGYTDDTVIHDGAAARGLAFIAKPFTRAALAQKVRDVLDIAGAAAAASAASEFFNTPEYLTRRVEIDRLPGSADRGSQEREGETAAHAVAQSDHRTRNA